MRQENEVSPLDHRLLDQDRMFCDRQPLHNISAIQPHGVLLVLSYPEFLIVQASRNVRDFFGREAESFLGKGPAALFTGAQAEEIRKNLEGSPEDFALSLGNMPLPGAAVKIMNVVARRKKDSILIELQPLREPAVKPHQIENFLKNLETRLQPCQNGIDVCLAAVPEIRRITGFDRILAHRFNEDWSGTVVAEDHARGMESYLGLRFPASDIPAQARSLYAVNAVRIIPDISYTPVPLVPEMNPKGVPTDLTFCALRSVLPVHIEYLKNMQITASASVSILKEGKLWGLIVCHHKSPKFLDHDMRFMLEMVSNIVSAKILSSEMEEARGFRRKLESVKSQLIQAVSSGEDFIESLYKHRGELLALAGADGAAISYGGKLIRLGAAPPENDVRALVDWLHTREGVSLYQTHTLAHEFPESVHYKDQASGILAVSLGDRFADALIWFRPEIMRTVQWGGDPGCSVNFEKNSTDYHPRNSFKLWQEEVRLQSAPWRDYEIEAVMELRISIVDAVLKVQNVKLRESAEDLMRSNKDLEQFAYVASHDMKEPLRTILNYTQLLTRRYQSIIKEEDREIVKFIVEASERAQQLVDDLLEYSRIRGLTKNLEAVDAHKAVDTALQNLESIIEEKQAKIMRDPLPVVMSNQHALTQVFQNLIGNAVKFTKGKTPEVHIAARKSSPSEWEFSVRDNGIGIDPKYFGRIFTIFERLHSNSEFPGTGIGLAVCKKIIERHGGKLWLESKPGEGTVFFFTVAST